MRTAELPGRVVPNAEAIPIRDEAEKVYHVRRVDTPPAIDGRAGEWQDVPAMVPDKKEQSRGVAGPGDLSGSLRLLWDKQALYFCLVVQDIRFARYL